MALTFGEKIDFNKQVLSEQIEELRDLAYWPHYTEPDDCWYSCPKAEDTCSPNYNHESKEQTCNCGADDHNNKVDELYAEIMENFFN